MSIFRRRGHRSSHPSFLFSPSIPGLLLFGALLGGAYVVWPMLGINSHPYVKGQASSFNTIGFDAVAAESLPKELTVTRIRSVYDGDTFRIESNELVSHDEKGILVRIRGVDAAEIDGDCKREELLARTARQWLVHRFNKATSIALQDVDYREDPHGRVVADVVVDGDMLSTQMVAAGAAKSWTGGSKPRWCGRT